MPSLTSFKPYNFDHVVVSVLPKYKVVKPALELIKPFILTQASHDLAESLGTVSAKVLLITSSLKEQEEWERLVSKFDAHQQTRLQVLYLKPGYSLEQIVSFTSLAFKHFSFNTVLLGELKFERDPKVAFMGQNQRRRANFTLFLKKTLGIRLLVEMFKTILGPQSNQPLDIPVVSQYNSDLILLKEDAGPLVRVIKCYPKREI